MNQPPRLVLGTHNRHKLLELEALLRPLGVELVNLDAYPQALEVEETGTTFAENAALKASEQARHLGQWVLAEDSGLAVDALGGAPGVYSARFSGPEATDASNNRLLLEKLADVPPAKRTAGYVCHAALSDPRGVVRATAEDYCRGRLRTEAAGCGGFGYDPLFEVVEYHRTFGELAPETKACLSHRGRAMRRIVVEIARLLRQGQWPTA